MSAQYQDLVKTALRCYASNEKMVTEKTKAQAFAAYMIQVIEFNI